MPSVTDVQQTSSNNLGKSTPPPPPPPSTTSMDSNNTDPLTQTILLLDKKQRNLGKRKEKLESYQEQERQGKELNKDQKEALAKYSDVLGQIDCLKELNEQFKKIQTEAAKNQKRLSKQVAEEKRQLLSQTLRQYAQIRYLLEHRPTSLQSDESTLFDQLSAVIIPLDNSSDSISRSVDTVLSIYQNGPSSTIKNLTSKNPQEIREILEELIQKSDQPEQEEQIEILSSSIIQQEQQQQQEVEEEEEPIKEIEQTNDIPLTSRTLNNDYPLQFDTRNQTIPLEQIFQDQTFFPIELNNQISENNRDQSPDPNQYLPTITVVNSSINDQASLAVENQEQNEQQGEGSLQQNRGRGRGGQYNNGNGNKNYNRRGQNPYYQQYRGPRGGGHYDNSYGGGGGHYDNSYGGGGQRPYYEHNRGRGGYRGNRGGNYRPYNYNGNGYQNSAQYQNVRSAPPSEEQ